MKTKKQKIKLLSEIYQLHNNLHRMQDHLEHGGAIYYKTGFPIKNNEDLILQITSLLEVCVFALDGNGMMLSPIKQRVIVEDSVCTVLDMALTLLSDT